MPTKLSSPPFQIAASVSMSGTTVFTSSVTGILYRDSLCYQFAWSGIPTGAFDIQGSVDYNQGLPQSGNNVNQGTWTSIALTPAPNATGSGGAVNILINMSQLSFPFTRVQYTNSTGSGFLGIWTSAKSFG